MSACGAGCVFNEGGLPVLRKIGRIILSLVGALAGGAVGYYAFGWILKQGFHALILPGFLLGAGCSILSANRSIIRGVVCGLAALALGVFTEWSYRPFAADDSLEYFIKHVHKLPPITLIMLGVGTALAAWFGLESYLLPWAGSRAPSPRPREPA
jgi:hypothetical protein